MSKHTKYLATGSEWDVSLIEKAWPIIDRMGKKYKWEGYNPQFEIITYDQMLEAYSTVGMPCCYDHWSYGRQYEHDKDQYKKGLKGLAYEMIINTDPAITYLMENNSACMQLLVMAHAAVGHNHFFKHNYLFKDWTDAKHILDYLTYAKRFIRKCEEKYGETVVENILDAAHSIKMFGIDKYQRRSTTIQKEKDKLLKRLEHQEKYFDLLFDDINTYNKTAQKTIKKLDLLDDNIMPDQDKQDENLLYFIATKAEHLRPWMREILKIVSNIAQYFYPQYQDKVMNEGFASFVHYTLMYDLYEAGLISDGYMLEFFDSHSGVTFQPSYKSKYYSGVNPYALGFNIFKDIERICKNPDSEDKKLFPDIAGSDWNETVNYVVQNYKDETFVLQFLSPKVIKKMGLFAYHADEINYNRFFGYYQRTTTITATEADEDYKHVKQALSRQYSLSEMIPTLEAHVEKTQISRRLILTHKMRHSADTLEDINLRQTLDLLSLLWGDTVGFRQTHNGTRTRDLLVSGKPDDIYTRRF